MWKVVPALLGAQIWAAAMTSEGPDLTIQTAHLAGRVYAAGETFLLEIDPGGARILRIDHLDKVRSALSLAKTSVPLQSSGLARSAEGVFWVLADRGRTLIGFDPSLGSVADLRPLPTACQLVWGVNGAVMLAALPLSGGQPLILQMTPAGFTECSSLRTRPVRDFLEAPILAMFACGASRTGELPCWWVAGEARIFFVGPTCGARDRTVPSLSRTRPAGPRDADPLDRFSFPIRDVFQIDPDRLWLLANQEGDKSPLHEDASVGRHLVLVIGGRARNTISLPKKARLVLNGDPTRVSVLYSDGTIERIDLP